MADNDRKRRFRSTRDRSSDAHPGALFYQPDTAATPAWAQPAPRRPAGAQATQDVIDVAAFVGKVETERSHGRPAPTPQSMQDVLGAFRGSPAAQTTIQILAAAATARHFGPQSANARKWEKLAQENAGRLEAAKAQQYRQNQTPARGGADSPDQVQQRTADRGQADGENDRRMFDAAAALALSYVAVKTLPPFDRLAELSRDHVTGAESDHVDTDALASGTARTHEEHGRGSEDGVDLGKETLHTDGPATFTESVEDADVSGELEQASRATQNSGTDPSKIGAVLQGAGRGLATAVGSVQGDDEVAPPLSPVNLSQLSQELLDALGAAMSGHPRSVGEMLNIEREPDRRNDTAFVLDIEAERGQGTALIH